MAKLINLKLHTHLRGPFPHKMVYMSPTKKAQIVTIKCKGKTNAQIAEEVGVNLCTVICTFHQYKKNPDFYFKKPKLDCPPKLTEAEGHIHIRMIAFTEAANATNV